MKETRKHIIGLVAGLAVLLLGAANGATAKELKFAVFEPPKSDVNSMVVVPFIKEVEKESNGSITFRHFAGGSLLGPRDTLTGVRDGVADVGFVVPAFVVSSLPHANIVPDLLTFADDAPQASGAGNETLLLDCKECKEDFKKMNAVTLGGYGNSPYMLQCAKEVRNFSDVKGKKIRVAGGASGRWVKILGGVGVGMPPNQIVTAMQRGQIDCAIAVPAWLKSFSMRDAVKYIIDFPMGTYHGLNIFTFNLNTWKGLSGKEKQIVLKAASRAIAYGTIHANYVDGPAYFKKTVAEKGITVSQDDGQFAAAWEKFKKGEVESVIESAKKRGIKNPRPMVESHLANLKKWEKLSKEAGADVEKFEKVLWDEVYSKLKY